MRARLARAASAMCISTTVVKKLMSESASCGPWGLAWHRRMHSSLPKPSDRVLPANWRGTWASPAPSPEQVAKMAAGCQSPVQASTHHWTWVHPLPPTRNYHRSKMHTFWKRQEGQRRPRMARAAPAMCTSTTVCDCVQVRPSKTFRPCGCE